LLREQFESFAAIEPQFPICPLVRNKHRLLLSVNRKLHNNSLFSTISYRRQFEPSSDEYHYIYTVYAN
jgi:hypothetical protein